MDIIHPFGGKTVKYETEFAGKKITVETGNMAFRADGAVTVRCGDTMVLATAVVEPKPKPDTDFFPLLIDYEERWYASGKISGSRYVKREAKPSDKAVLTSRLIDRPIRPLFPKGYRNDVQVVVTVLSADLENEPDILSIIAASTALMLSGAPFEGPVAAARIGMIEDKLVDVVSSHNQVLVQKKFHLQKADPEYHHYWCEEKDQFPYTLEVADKIQTIFNFLQFN